MGGTAGRWRLALGALTLAASAELALPGPAAAQTAFTLGGTPYTLDGDVEVGARFFLAEPSERNTAKFEEYRDIADGLFLEALRLRLARPDESFAIELGGSRWGQTDQDYSLRAGRPGVWDFGFEWDQLRHLYSTTARLLSVDVEPNHFVLPTPRPALSVHNTLSERRDVASQWETMRLWAGFNPVEKLELKAEYSRIHKEGSRPIGMAFGSPSNNFLELLEPIDQTIHDFKLRAAWAEESYQIQFQYGLSIFHNEFSALTADNPCFANAAACGASDGGAAAPRTGQTSLPPSNMAHSLSLSAGVTLPKSIPVRIVITCLGGTGVDVVLRDDDTGTETAASAVCRYGEVTQTVTPVDAPGRRFTMSTTQHGAMWLAVTIQQASSDVGGG